MLEKPTKQQIDELKQLSKEEAQSASGGSEGKGADGII
jgi:hypothetical protein